MVLNENLFAQTDFIPYETMQTILLFSLVVSSLFWNDNVEAVVYTSSKL